MVAVIVICCDWLYNCLSWNLFFIS